jgi:PAS domain S-box-containing protein
MTGQPKPKPLVTASAAGLALGLLLLDLSLPLGMAGGVAYIALVVAGWWFPARKHVLLLAALATLLTVAGFLLSLGSGSPWIEAANRCLALFAIWVTAGLLVLAKQNEAALRESTATLAEAQRQAKVGSWRWSVTEDRLISCTEEVARIHGVSQDAFHDLVKHQMDRIIHPEDRVRVARAFKQFDEDGSDYKVDYRVVRPDGEVRHVLEIGKALCDESGRAIEQLGTVQDITDLKQAERALSESESLLRHAAQMADLGYWVWDEIEQRCVYCSETLAQINDVTVQEYLANYSTMKTLLPELHPEDRERYQRVISGAVEQVRGYDIEYRCFMMDGGLQYLRERGEPVVDDHGRLVRTVGILQDITIQREAEKAISAAKEKAELASRAKSEFLANMSHELRTPLNAIIGFAEVIKDEAFGSLGVPKYQDYAQDIHTSGRHLFALINDILDLSKLEAGDMEVQEEEVDVLDCIRSCVTMVGDRAKAGGVDLVTDVAETSLHRLRADRRILNQILINLLSNAVKFTPAGGRVAVVAGPVPGEGYVLRVTDTGVGIAPEDIPKALSRFGQIDSQLGRRYEGTGLGLPLTKSFAEMLGGSFELRSALGDGTSAIVRFPEARILLPHDSIGTPDRGAAAAG